MTTIVLQIADAHKEHDRYNTDATSKNWEGVASASDKEMMLDNMLEMLNDESLDVTNSWLRLVTYADDTTTVTNMEVF